MCHRVDKIRLSLRQSVSHSTMRALRERGCSSRVTVQKICKTAKNENEVREILDTMWENTGRSGDLLEVQQKNKKIYEFEKTLEESSK